MPGLAMPEFSVPGSSVPGSSMPAWEKYRILRAESEFASVRKDSRTAFLIWCATGLLGGHRFYLGDTARSIAMLFTLGGLGLWTIADVLVLKRRVETVNTRRRAAIMAAHGVIESAISSPPPGSPRSC